VLTEPHRECIPNHQAQPEGPRGRMPRGQPEASQLREGPCDGQGQSLPAVPPWSLILAMAFPLLPGVNDKPLLKTRRDCTRSLARRPSQ
jgi:hypothetical protein